MALDVFDESAQIRLFHLLFLQQLFILRLFTAGWLFAASGQVGILSILTTALTLINADSLHLFHLFIFVFHNLRELLIALFELVYFG